MKTKEMNKMQEITSLDFQKKNKPKIEDVIPHYLDNKAAKAAIDFASYLQTNKTQLKWASENRWKAVYAKSTFCWVWLYQNGWQVSPCLSTINDYEDFIINEGWQDFILERLNPCHTCNPTRSCINGRNINILKKNLNNACVQHICGGIYLKYEYGVYPQYVNPDKMAIERIEKLLALEKQARDEYSRKL